MGQMAAVRKIHSQNRVAVFAGGQVNGHIGLTARMRLNVDVIGAEQLFGALDSQGLDHVGEFASTVVAFARIPFGVFVREDRPGGLEDSLGNKVFRGDQLEPLVLTASFVMKASRLNLSKVLIVKDA